MGSILFFLLLALLFFGLGFAAHLLWIAAMIFFVAWVAGFAFLALGGIAVARTGFDFNQLTSKHVDVAGSTQSQLTG